MSMISFTIESTCPGYLTGPADSKQGIVLIQEAFGVNDEVKATADRFGKEGYKVVAPDLFRGKVYTTIEEVRNEVFKTFNWDNAIKDIAGAVNYLKSSGCQKIGVIGHCMGGGLSIVAASRIPFLDCAVCFYGTPSRVESFDHKTIKIPIQAHFGNLDKHITLDVVAQLEEKLKQNNSPVTFYRYDADHAFMNATRPMYSKENAEKAWNTTLDFFKQYLKV